MGALASLPGVRRSGGGVYSRLSTGAGPGLPVLTPSGHRGAVDGIGSGPGRWQVTCADGEVLIVDTISQRLTVVGEDRAWPLVAVDECDVGRPAAFAYADAAGCEWPWWTDRVVSVVPCGRNGRSLCRCDPTGSSPE